MPKLACGFLSAVPERRALPLAFQPVVLHEGSILCPGGERISEQEFRDLEEEREATWMTPVPFREDHCVFVPEDDGAPCYLPVGTAASRFKEFADEQTRIGDLFFERGDEENALVHYADAAAAAQEPAYYRKMLACRMSAKRRRSTEAAIALLEGPPGTRGAGDDTP